jgi:hypothetical protein
MLLRYLLIMLVLFMGTISLAQDSQIYTVDLSNPQNYTDYPLVDKFNPGIGYYDGPYSNYTGIGPIRAYGECYGDSTNPCIGAGSDDWSFNDENGPGATDFTIHVYRPSGIPELPPAPEVAFNFSSCKDALCYYVCTARQLVQFLSTQDIPCMRYGLSQTQMRTS